MPKKFTIQTTVTLKIATGNFESVDVTKMMTTEVECEPPELPEKSGKTSFQEDYGRAPCVTWELIFENRCVFSRC